MLDADKLLQATRGITMYSGPVINSHMHLWDLANGYAQGIVAYANLTRLDVEETLRTLPQSSSPNEASCASLKNPPRAKRLIQLQIVYREIFSVWRGDRPHEGNSCTTPQHLDISL